MAAVAGAIPPFDVLEAVDPFGVTAGGGAEPLEGVVFACLLFRGDALG